MNKTATLMLALVGFSLQSFAQDSRITFRVNNFHRSASDTKVENATAKSTGKGIQTVFGTSVGYAHTFKNKVGVGAEFGIGTRIDKGDGTVTYTSQTTYADNSKRAFASYYIGLHVYESFKFKNYIGNIGLVVPIELVTKNKYTSESSTKDNSQNTTQTTVREETIPKQLTTGLFVQPAIYRKVYKKIYAGAELGIGIVNTRTSGTTTNSEKKYANGVLIDANKTETTGTYSYAQLTTRATISVQYIF